ncbi:MAG: energy transducer TonB [Bacteroidales bacterium]
MNTLTKYLFFTLSLCVLKTYSQINSQVSIQQEAQFPGGDRSLIQYIYENIHWPENIKGNVINDQCIISVDVRSDSLIENIVFLKKVGYGIDEQISELLKRKKFIPSIQNNIPVKMSIVLTIPIQYRKK